MGFDPPSVEGAEFTEWKTDAFTNQATTAGLLFTVTTVWNTGETGDVNDALIEWIKYGRNY